MVRAKSVAQIPDFDAMHMTFREARLKRMQWRCRRGTRELDALLGGWLQANATTAEDAELAAFDALLDQQDPELWDWLLGHAEPPRADWCAIVADIRQHAGLTE